MRWIVLLRFGMWIVVLIVRVNSEVLRRILMKKLVIQFRSKQHRIFQNCRYKIKGVLTCEGLIKLAFLTAHSEKITV